jgi:hypothetical protein
MSAFFARSTLRVLSLVKVLALALVLLLSPLPAPATESVAVAVDQAKLFKLPEKVATIVIGNPLIADITLQPGGTVVVTGKSYGTTNMMALDRAGSVVMDRLVQVEGPAGKLVTVYRGVDRETYSCTPTCQRRITLGDTQSYFDATIGQSGTFANRASGMAATADSGPAGSGGGSGGGAPPR